MTIRADGEVGMRGADNEESGMFSYISAERRVPKDHPLRAIRVMVDSALRESSWRFDAVYASSGRPSIPPEKDRKSTRLNSSHQIISYAVFCLKKKKTERVE